MLPKLPEGHLRPPGCIPLLQLSRGLRAGCRRQAQLEYASQLLRAKATSGSARLYSQGLANAASSYQSKPVTPDNAMELVAVLMGSNQPQQPAVTQDPVGGLTSSLLSGLMSGEQPQTPAASADPLGGLAGSLLSGVLGGSNSVPTSRPEQPQGGIDAGDLLQAGMSYMQAKQRGASTLEALVSAIMALPAQ